MAEPPGHRKNSVQPNLNNQVSSLPISYATVVSSSLIRHDLSSIPVKDIVVSLRQSQWKEGKHAVVFSLLELQRSETPLQYALIAKFSKSCPRMDVIQHRISTKWDLSAIPIVSFIDRRHVLIKLQNAEDFSKTWTCDSQSIEGSLFRLFKWSSDFNAKEECPVTPVWIRLPIIPLNFYMPSYLRAIVRPLVDIWT